MIALTPPPVDDRPWHQRFVGAVRHPVRWLDALTGDGPVLALLILIGLNAVDELARTSFSVVAPDRRRLLRRRAGRRDRAVRAGLRRRASPCRCPSPRWPTGATGSAWPCSAASIFAVCSALVGLAPEPVGAGGVPGRRPTSGKAVIEPAHTSLLADYYPVELRPRVFSFHRAGNAVGALVGGIGAGLRRRGLRVAGAVLRLRHPDASLLVLIGRAAARAGPRPAGAHAWSPPTAESLDDRGGRRPAWPRAGACAGRSTACGGSTARCRSSPRRWRASPSSARSSTETSSGSTSRPGAGSSGWSRGRRSWSGSSSAPAWA